MNPFPLLSFWLLPTAEERAIFQAIIHRLAQRYEAVEFCPHITLFTIPATTVLSHQFAVGNPAPSAISLMDWDTSLRPGLAKLQPLSLRVQDVCSGPEFAKTVFIRFNTTPELLDTMTYLQQTVSPYPFSFTAPIDPHISLLYQTLDAETKKSIAQSIHIPLRVVHFDEIQIIQAPLQFGTVADVRQLQRLYSRSLTY